MLELLTGHTAGQPWWLGYLDTGADDVVFADAPRVTLYAGWEYLLVEAGPRQAASWRTSDAGTFWKEALPNLMFPADRSWLVSTLWDDEWTCIGGRAALVEDLLHDPELGPQARQVELGDDDATHRDTKPDDRPATSPSSPRQPRSRDCPFPPIAATLAFIGQTIGIGATQQSRRTS